MSIALVFMLAYGIGRDVILNPGTDRSFATFVGRLFVPYFQMYGELLLTIHNKAVSYKIF